MDIEFYRYNDRKFITRRQAQAIASVGEPVFLGIHGRWYVVSREQRFDDSASDTCGYQEVWIVLVEERK